jgi:hypothetical protein
LLNEIKLEYLKGSGRIIVVGVFTLMLAGCASNHAESVRVAQDKLDNFTVAKVQSAIQVGMKGSQVIKAIGSPNIITKSDLGETWIYDRIYSEKISSNSRGSFAAKGIGGLLIGDGFAGGWGGPSISGASSAEVYRQQTLTAIIEFKGGKVTGIDYHASRF